MSLATELLKPVSEKTFILNVALDISHITWINYEPGIWYYTLNPESPVIVDAGGGDDWTYTNMSNVTINVSSVTVDSTAYTSTASLAGLRSQNEGFMWDNIGAINGTAQTIYMHFDSFYPYYVFSSIRLGADAGYANRSFYDSNDTYYEGLVQSVPNISMKKDPLFFGIASYNGGTVAMSNVEGDFDNFDIFGKTITGKFGFRDLAIADWSTVFEMYAEKVRFDYFKSGFKLKDKRKSLSLEISDNVFDDTTYPDISDDDKNKPLPLAWGTVRDCPVVISNSQEGGGPAWVVKLCDTSKHNIKSGQTPVVYVDGVSETISNFINTAGTCTIANGSYDPAESQEVTADFIGQVDGSDDPIVNGQEVIEDILNEYLSFAFTAANYNLTEWNAEKATSYDVSLFLTDKMKISDIIELVSISNAGIFLIQNDGLFTFRTYDENREISQTIEYDELLGSGQYPDLSVEYPTDQYLTDATIGYDRGWSSGRFRTVVNDTYRAATFLEIGVYNSRRFDTILINEADAIELAETIMSRAKDVDPTITVTTQAQSMEIEIMKFVELSTTGNSRTLFGKIVAEVVGFKKNMLTGTVDLAVKYVKDALGTASRIIPAGNRRVTPEGYNRVVKF